MVIVLSWRLSSVCEPLPKLICQPEPSMPEPKAAACVAVGVATAPPSAALRPLATPPPPMKPPAMPPIAAPHGPRAAPAAAPAAAPCALKAMPPLLHQQQG